ncbi:MAG: tRNA lysidine(34) synthetase TilS [Thiolinea sp.]
MKKANKTSATSKAAATNSVVSTQLQAFFRRHPAKSCLVAYSGGLDSHVLLHALTHETRNAFLPSPPAGARAGDGGKERAPQQIRAIHIKHNLQSASADWAEHCRKVCAALNIELEVVELNLQVPAGSSVEAVAREARYQAFSEHLQPGEVLLTAHHQDDQAETLLLNLLRGSGPEGLAAMPESRPFVDTVLLRPLLGLSRAQLQAYAQAQQLSWIDDPSNASRVFDRNYLRHEVMPVLEQRWPAAARLLARAAQWQGEAVQLQSDLLADKLQQVQGAQNATLSVAALLACNVVLQKALIRQWLSQAGFSTPSVKKLQHILSDVLAAKPDAQPCVSWEGCEVRRYRDNLYALTPLPAHDPQQVLAWSPPYESLSLASLDTCLEAQALGALLPELLQLGKPLQVRFRAGGEKLKRGDIHISLKQWFQEQGIPPWQRERLPLIYLGSQLLVIPGLFELAVADLKAPTQ